YFGLLISLTPVLGGWMARVFERKTTGRIEKWIYRLGRVGEAQEMSWKGDLAAGLVFNLVGFLSLWLLQVAQAFLPLNPQKFGNVSWHLAFNTAMSFTTNTNWQAYMGESTMSYLTQMIGLAVHNFVSAATGFGVLLAIIRGFQ